MFLATTVNTVNTVVTKSIRPLNQKSNNFFETHCAILIAVVKQLVTAKAACLYCLSAESNVL